MTQSPLSDAAANGANAKEELYKLACRLERQNAVLKEELERNTQEIDSYGEPGSNFRICSYCHAESGVGVLDKGIPHEADCILSNVGSELSPPASGAPKNTPTVAAGGD